MATCSEKSPTKPGKTESAVFYGHDTKKLRLRAVSAEKDTFSKYILKPLAKKISWAQLILGGLVCGTQIVTMSLVCGRYSYYDDMANIGGGIWSSLITMCAAILSLWGLKNAKYWKLHLSFATHIISMLAAIVILIVEFSGNIRSIKSRIGEALYGDDDNHGSYYGSSRKELSAPMLITSLILNTFMATGTLVQLVSSFVMTLMTGRAICCGQSKTHGKLFELEIAGSETADGMVVVKNQVQNNLHGIGNMIPVSVPLSAPSAVEPPPYAESVGVKESV